MTFYILLCHDISQISLIALWMWLCFCLGLLVCRISQKGTDESLWNFEREGLRKRNSHFEEERMRTMYNWGPTRRPTDLTFWKTSNGHISATGHPIHFMFCSRIGFSRSADRMDQLPVGPNPGRHLGKFQTAISLKDCLVFVAITTWRSVAACSCTKGYTKARGGHRMA